MPTLLRFQTALRPFVPFILRLGLGFVFLWSGLSKFGVDGNALGVCTNRVEAVGVLATYAWLPFDPEIFVTVQSVGEIILGLMMVVGFWVELATGVSFLLYLLFFFLLDFSLIWKNVGLTVATLALLGSEPDRFRLDSWLAAAYKTRSGGNGLV